MIPLLIKNIMCYFLWLEGHSLFTSFAGAKKKKKKKTKKRTDQT